MMLARVWIREALGQRRPVESHERHLHEAMMWLCRAQDEAGGEGVSRSYCLRFQPAHKRRGWLTAYPETTGYIIPTFCNYATWSGNEHFRQRALRMAQWEVKIQMECGAVQGGVIDFCPTPAVFNTGQVLFGWARAFRETGDDQFRKAAVRAANFLVENQDRDGAWRRNGSVYARAGINLYDARTAWGLLEAFRITGDECYKTSAMQNLDFVCARQLRNGWFPDCCLDDNDRPLLHTLAYTMEGLLEAGAYLKETRYMEAAQRAANALLHMQREDGSLAGRFDCDWRPTASWSCLTGDAQTAVVWFRLSALTGDRKYFQAGRRMNRFLMATQELSVKDAGVRGGIKGSHPIWAEYAPYEYPNWAAKFFADALLLETKPCRKAGEEGWL